MGADSRVSACNTAATKCCQGVKGVGLRQRLVLRCKKSAATANTSCCEAKCVERNVFVLRGMGLGSAGKGLDSVG